MINNIQGYNNYSVSFKGIDAKSIQKFIPEIGDEAATHLSKYFDAELPADDFKYVGGTPEKFMHLSEVIPGIKFPVGEAGYAGANNKIDKLTFLHKLVEKIETNTLYNK